MRFFYYLFLPGIYLFNGTANAVVRLFGVPPPSETEETHSEEELRIIIEQSARRGVLDTDERDMLEGIFELGETGAREIMIPRPDVISLPASMPLGELFSVMARGNHTRYPVHEDDSSDRIVGAVHVRDVMRAAETEGLQEPRLTARDLAREVLIVPENRPIDEWGSFEGLITIEDILEEIVGEIREKFDEEEPTIRKLSDGSYSIDGRVPIQVVNEVLHSRFESEDFDTIGGLVFGHLGHAPGVGDEVRLDDHVLRVDETDGSRVARLAVRKT